jgi:hypothetical protein
VLFELRDFFGCGSVRRKSPVSSVEVYVVHSTIQLSKRIIPFFEANELRVKRGDFEKFADIVASIRSRHHHRPEEFSRLVRVAYSMNARGKQRKRPIEEVLLGSSETAREVPLRVNGEDTVRSPWRHGESGRNDLAAGPGDR